MNEDSPLAIVAGVGPGLGAALCRRLSAAGYSVAGLSRSREFTDELAAELEAAGGTARMLACDLTDEHAVRAALDTLTADFGPPAVLIYNAGAIAMRPFAETPAEEFDRLWAINCRGAFLCAHYVVPAMQARGHGTIIFTGASASTKAAARFAAFGAAKFALRGMAQSMARELGPHGIHVAHVIIDGMIWTPKNSARPGVTEDNTLHPDAIAQSYLALIDQDRSAWTQELDLRPDIETF
jgi:NAD(P)-dependent dehydrogenase (short-subunit alcohol dehydrogenase family)